MRGRREQLNHLAMPVSHHGEIAGAEILDGPAVAIGDGDIHGDDVSSTDKDLRRWRLRSRHDRQCPGQETAGQQPRRLPVVGTSHAS